MAVHDRPQLAGRRPITITITIKTTITALALLFAGCDRRAVDVGVSQELGYQQSAQWPVGAVQALLGEVSGVDVDGHGHIFVFHRATRGWDVVTRAPIAEATVLMLDSANGRLLNAWGANQFRLPHGLTVDRENNIWLTDAALHQVFQFTHDGALRRSWGEASVSGRDTAHFNRPTDVTPRADGGFYVSDGYENQRVVQFRANGSFARAWGRQGSGPGEFALPHMITGRADRLSVADRENQRIVEFDTAGVFVRVLQPQREMLVYAVAVDSSGRLFVGLRNDALGLGAVARLTGAGAIDLILEDVRRDFPLHDLAIDRNGSVYVAETRSGGLRKFTILRERK